MTLSKKKNNYFVINWEDFVSASLIIRYSAARRCFLVISSSFNGLLLSLSFNTSTEEVLIYKINHFEKKTTASTATLSMLSLSTVLRETLFIIKKNQKWNVPFQHFLRLDELSDFFWREKHILNFLLLIWNGLLISLLHYQNGYQYVLWV